MSVDVRAETRSEDEALEAEDTDDFDVDLGDGRKSGHVAPILPPA